MFSPDLRNLSAGRSDPTSIELVNPVVYLQDNPSSEQYALDGTIP